MVANCTASSVEIVPNISYQGLGLNSSIHEDANGEMSLEEITSEESQSKFILSKDSIAYFGFKQPCWFNL